MSSPNGPDFSETVAMLTADVEEKLYTRGAQVCVSRKGQVLLDSSVGDDGLGRTLHSDTIFRVYCTIKPVTALAVALLVEAGGLDLDRPLSEYLGPTAVSSPRVTARHLLNHTAGLHPLTGVAAEMMSATERRSAIAAIQSPPGWRIGIDAGYSEYAGWMLLGELMQRITGEAVRDYLRRAVLQPIGMVDTWIGMTSAEYASVADRIGVNVDLRGDRAFPMLFERTERVCCETNPAHGGYSTARDLARLYDALLSAQSGQLTGIMPSAITLREFCSVARPRSYDVVLDRECDYGLGFMVNLKDHFFGAACSPDSFGHSGHRGSSFAFLDPKVGVSVAVIFNGLVDHESSFVRRARIVRRVYEDLAI
jgi:CubicO group peptidase (beta-lactamase class C family)